MRKIYLCALAACVVSLTVAPALAEAPPAMPFRYHLPVVAAKEALGFRELKQRTLRYENNDLMRIDGNVSLGSIRLPKDDDQTSRHRSPKGFGFKGEWRF